MLTRRVLAALIVLGLTGLLACSSDPDTPLGNEFAGGILGSKPGNVFQDTIAISVDTVLAFNSLITQSDSLEVGRINGYRRSIVLRPDFATPPGNETRVVQSAELQMRKNSGSDVRVILYTLANPYTEGDSVAVLDTKGVIVDPTNGEKTRVVGTLTKFPLPPELVQGWIRGDSLNNGMAVVYFDTTGSDARAILDSSESTGKEAEVPQIEVKFKDDPQTPVTYGIPDDATFVRATTTTPNLVVSDGYVRRVYFRFDLSDLPDSAAVHRARIQMHLASKSTPAGSYTFPAVELYIPDSADFANPGIRTGQLVTSADSTLADGTVEFTVTNALLAVLSGELKDTGWAIKMIGENAAVRYVQFYPSSDPDPNLRPRIVLTASTPATFVR